MIITVKSNNNLKKIKTEIQKATNLHTLAKSFFDEAKRNARSYFKKDTGKMAKSVKMKKVNDQHYQIFTDIPYGKIQDTGGEIRPKQSKYLAIPLKNRKDSPKKYSDLVCIKSKNNLLLMSKTTKEFFYVLKKKVKIKGTGWWSDAYTHLSQKLYHIQRRLQNILK